MTRSRTIISAFASLALGTLMASPAFGALTASPNPSSTGSYTVSGSVSANRTYEWMWLIETAPGGATMYYDVYDLGNISQSFSSKPVGTYSYQVEGCYIDESQPLEPVDVCEYVGASLSVSVIAPPADLMPDFGDASVSDKSWTQDHAIAAFTVPGATGGNTPLSYTVSGLPDGVTMSQYRYVSGTPTENGSGTVTVTVTDEDGDTDTLRFGWTVGDDPMPSFDGRSVSDKTWTQDEAIGTFYVPSATGGNTPLSYTADGLPTGVSMSSFCRVSGTPTATGMGTATVTVEDDDGDTDPLSFDWTVEEAPPPDLMPDFGNATVSAKSWTQNQSITVFTVPSAMGGDTPLSYDADDLPAGVSMSSARSVSGTPTAHGSGTATITVSDEDGDIDTLEFDWTVNEDLMPDFGTATVTVTDDNGDTDTLSFEWTVEADTEPMFSVDTLASRSWADGAAIAAFTVDEATGGNAPLTLRVLTIDTSAVEALGTGQ